VLRTNRLIFVPDEPLKLSLMFAGKAEILSTSDVYMFTLAFVEKNNAPDTGN